MKSQYQQSPMNPNPRHSANAFYGSVVQEGPNG